MALRIKLFGGPVVIDDTGQALKLPTRKSEALFAYLVEQKNQSVSREVLADLLWPYSGPDQARASLRQEVSVLRKALGSGNAASIFSDGDRLGFSQYKADVDLWKFRDLAGADLTISRQTALLALYTSPFLSSFRIRSQPFSNWVWVTSQAEETSVLKVGETVMRQWKSAGYSEEFAEFARHLCRIDPTYEPAHCGLIEFYIKHGDLHLAKHQMRLCEAALKTQLDTKPSFETIRLAEDIQQRLKQPTMVPPNSELEVTLTNADQQRRFVVILTALLNNRAEDPEEFENAAADFSAVASDVADAKGGVQILTGNDRILVCFGFPNTHDRLADAAAGTAFDILDAIEKGSRHNAQCQIGISAGLALVSTHQLKDKKHIRVSGAVTRDSEEIARQAHNSMVWVNETVFPMLSSNIRLRDVPNASGVKQLVPKPRQNQATDYDAFSKHHQPMVGRDAPLAQLNDALEQAKLAVGSAVEIVGAPGSGKSRLVAEAITSARSEGVNVKYFQGNLNDRNSVLAPVIDHMLRAGAFEPTGQETQRQALEFWLSSINPELVQVLEYFISLSGITSRQPLRAGLVSKATKGKALDIFVDLASHATLQQPLLLVFEDAHWFDPTTCEALGNLIDVLENLPVCVLLVSREGESPRVSKHPLVQKLSLMPLDRQNADLLLHGLTKGTNVSDSTMSNILERAEGNPLYLEEFAIALVNRGNQAALRDFNLAAPGLNSSESAIAAPERLSPLLLSRIDNVPGAAQVLQNASVLGRRFSLNHLSKLLLPVVVRPSLMNEIEAAGLIFATQRGRDATYIFKHALITEAIYSTIPIRDRITLHKSVAAMLSSDEKRIDDANVARHFKAAYAFEEASQYFELSGDQAVRVAAHAEAISEYSEAMEMAGQMPLSQDRARKELALNRKVAAQIIGLHGIPTEDATPYFTRAWDLSLELGDREETVNAAWGLWSIHLMVAELDECLKIANAIADDLEETASVEAQLIAAYMLGVTHAYRGTLKQASHYFKEVGNHYTEALKEGLINRFGMDIGLTADSFHAWVYALLGEAKNASLASQRALDRAKHINAGLGHVFAHVFSATKCLFLDEIEEARHLAEIALKRAQEMGFRQWIAQSKLQLARIADLSGDPNALDALCGALAEYRQTNMVLARPYAQVWIAEAMIRRGQYQAALQELDDLQAFTAISSENYFDDMICQAREKALQSLNEGATPSAFSG